MARVGAQPQSEEAKRLEEENYTLRKRLSAQREEIRVEQKNIDLLRNELALLKTALRSTAESAETATAPASTPPLAPISTRVEAEKVRDEHREEMRSLKTTHQRELSELKASFQKELSELRSAHQKDLATQRAKALVAPPSLAPAAPPIAVTPPSTPAPPIAATAPSPIPAPSPAAASDQADLNAQIADLKQKNTAFRQKNTDLREKNGALENKLRELTATLSNTAVASLGDDLSVLKGVGPATLKALHALGITSFHEIATWTDSDIETIAPKIKLTAARIRKNGWVEAATRFESTK